MYPRSFLSEKAKIKQRTPLQKELCEIGEEGIWESRFKSFFNIFSLLNRVVWKKKNIPRLYGDLGKNITKRESRVNFTIYLRTI